MYDLTRFFNMGGWGGPPITSSYYICLEMCLDLCLDMYLDMCLDICQDMCLVSVYAQHYGEAGVCPQLRHFFRYISVPRAAMLLKISMEYIN